MSDSVPVVYLAGPISGESYERATDWRQTARILLGQRGFASLDPMRGKGFLAGTASLLYTYNDEPLGRSEAVFHRDTGDVLNAEAMLVNLGGASRVSVGTMFEMGLAWANRKPIVVVLPQDEPQNLHHGHPFVHQPAARVVSTLSEAVQALYELRMQGRF